MGKKFDRENAGKEFRADEKQWKESEKQVLKRLKISKHTENISLQKYLKWLRDRENDFSEETKSATKLLADYSVGELELRFPETDAELYVRDRYAWRKKNHAGLTELS